MVYREKVSHVAVGRVIPHDVMYVQLNLLRKRYSYDIIGRLILPFFFCYPREREIPVKKHIQGRGCCTILFFREENCLSQGVWEGYPQVIMYVQGRALFRRYFICDKNINYTFPVSTGWTMVFKLVSGVSADVYQLWSSASSLNENNREALNTNSSLKEHYKNRLVQNWQTANPKEVSIRNV